MENFANKLLRRQIKKYLNSTHLASPAIQSFLEAVQNSYNEFETNSQFSDHVFEVAEKEYLAVNKRLIEAEKKLSERNEKLTVLNADLESRVAANIQEIREKEERYRALVENAQDLIYRMDSNGFFTYANPSAIELMGYSMQELKQTKYPKLVLSSHVNQVVEKYTQCIVKQEREFYLEIPALKKDGDVIWLGQHLVFNYHPDGKVDYVDVVARDLTSIKRLTQRFENLVSNLQSGVIVESQKGEVELINQRIFDLMKLDLNADQFIGKSFTEITDLFSQLTLEEVDIDKEIEKLRQANTLVKAQRIRLNDGRVLEYNFIPTTINDYATGRIWTFRDITSQVQFVDAIKRSEQRYRNMIASMNLGLLEVDHDDYIVFANQQFCQMSGYRLEELIDKKSTEIFVTKDKSKLSHSHQSKFNREGIKADEVFLKDARGKDVWWLISSSAIDYGRHEESGSIGIYLDITEQKNLEKELTAAKQLAEHSSKAKDIFLANMSHEIRTPMNGIVGMARELSKTNLETKQRFFLDTIQAAADNLLVILNDILDLSKIEAGKLSIENVSFELGEVFRQARRVLLPKAEEKGLRINMLIAPDLAPVVCGDPYRLNQVLLNIIGNAIKFTSKGAISVLVEVTKQTEKEQVVQIDIQDQGIGIEKAFLNRLFENFTQEEKSTARRFGGTGLGLSISKQLVELMGGSIHAHSEKNIGTTITLKIPFGISTVKPDELKAKGRNHDLHHHKGKRILVVEDNHMNRLVLEATLGHFDFEIHLAGNGFEAVEAVQSTDFDLILMDVQMPEMDGLQATKIIRKKLNLQIPIIALTAYALKGDKEKYQKAGMNDFIPKPFDEDLMLNRISKWLSGNVKEEDTFNPSELKPSAKSKESGGLYSLEKLRKISHGSDEFVSKMLNIFLKTGSEALENMKVALANSDYNAIKTIAHKQKPSVSNLMIKDLVEEIKNLEEAAIQQDEKKTQILGKLFIDRISEVIESLKER